MIAVLRWIHDNIHAFGGDPDRVTLLGHGIGADFVDLLVISPLAKGKDETSANLFLPFFDRYSQANVCLTDKTFETGPTLHLMQTEMSDHFFPFQMHDNY